MRSPSLLRRLLLGLASACALGALAATPPAAAQALCASTSGPCLSLGLGASSGARYGGATDGAQGLVARLALASLTAGRTAAPTDSLRRLLARPLAEPWALIAGDSLPSGMPLNTKILWGRRGVLRTLGVGPSTRRGERMMRRSMLGWHQRLGLLTFAAMTTQVILGELIVADPARHYESLQPVHKPLGYATFGLYSATAVLSIAAPPGRRYSSGGFSSIRLHRWLAVVHFAGMMSMPWLGRSIAEAQGFEQFQDRQRRHQVVGRVTYGAFALALASTFLAH